jgi:hypothetical protein
MVAVIIIIREEQPQADEVGHRLVSGIGWMPSVRYCGSMLEGVLRSAIRLSDMGNRFIGSGTLWPVPLVGNAMDLLILEWTLCRITLCSTML